MQMKVTTIWIGEGDVVVGRYETQNQRTTKIGEMWVTVFVRR